MRGATNTLTPSEVALAKVLVAWESWTGLAEGPWKSVVHVLLNAGLTTGASLTAQGQELLDRARKAGVL